MAAYDDYNYPKFWKSRSYEHASEVLALNAFLKKIPKGNILDIGGGYGRLAPYYLKNATSATIIEPSKRLTKIAQKNLKNFKITFKNLHLEEVKYSKKKYDTVLMVRVMHHIDNPELAFSKVDKLIKKGGYFILEYANKRHWKAVVNNFLRGNFTFILDLEKKDVRKNNKCIPFCNHHPDTLNYLIEKHRFKIVDSRSVSNIRLPLLKKILSDKQLLFMENFAQKPLSRFYFGPSIFLLLKKD